MAISGSIPERNFIEGVAGEQRKTGCETAGAKSVAGSAAAQAIVQCASAPVERVPDSGPGQCSMGIAAAICW